MSKPRITYVVQGIITLTAHAHQTAPDGGAEGVTPQMKTGVTFGEKRYDVPCITANSVRGLIRRACGDVIMDELEKAKEQISRNVFLSIKRGSYARTGLDAGGASFMQMNTADTHPFVGLFGGGAHMYHSRVSMMGDLMPLITVTSGLFPERYQASCIDLQPWQLMDKTLIASRDDFERIPNGNVIENLEDAYTEHMSAKFGQNLAKKTQKAEAKAEGQAVLKSEKLKTDDLNTFTQVECIIPGTPMYFGMKLVAPTDAQVGLLLSGIQAWANRNALGGGSCRGRGTFKASLQLFREGELQVENLLAGEAGSYKLSDQVDTYMQALQQEIHAGMAKAQLLSALYPTVVKETAPAKGKAKAEAEA